MPHTSYVATHGYAASMQGDPSNLVMSGHIVALVILLILVIYMIKKMI